MVLRPEPVFVFVQRDTALGAETEGGKRIVHMIVFGRLIVTKLDLAARQ